jgi:hypothetical protein
MHIDLTKQYLKQKEIKEEMVNRKRLINILGE